MPLFHSILNVTTAYQGSQVGKKQGGNTPGIQRKGLLSVLLSDEMPSKMLSATPGDEGAWEGWAGTVSPHAHTHAHTHTYTHTDAGSGGLGQTPCPCTPQAALCSRGC